MANTRSSSNKKQEEPVATVSNDIKCYFEKLIVPLVRIKFLEDLFNKLKVIF